MGRPAASPARAAARAGLTLIGAACLLVGAACHNGWTVTGSEVHVDPSTVDGAHDPDPGTGEGPLATYPPEAWCSPDPVRLSSGVLPDLFAHVMAFRESGCALEAVHVDEDGNGTIDTRIAVPSRPCDGCVELLPAFALTWDQPDAHHSSHDAHWRGWVEAGLRQNGELVATLVTRRESFTATQRFERVYDPAGRLLEERQFFNDALWFEVKKTWRGDRLVAATVADHINGTGATRYTWRYDAAGRMAASRVTRGGSAWDAAYRYDDAGRLVALERAVDLEVWLTQAWRWDGDGRLESRTSRWTATPGHYLIAVDDLQPWHFFDSPHPAWANALPRARGGCALPPVSLVHGYPAGEGVWHVGWPDGAQPGPSSFDYGFAGYFNPTWFGHGGAGAGAFRPQSGDATITYDAFGRMVEEVLRSDLDDEASTVVRARAHANGRLISDVRRVAGTDDRRETTLAFTYDEDGRLVERTYAIGDRLAARHLWAWDDAGRAVSNAIAWHADPLYRAYFIDHDYTWEPAPLPEEVPDEAPPHRTTILRGFEEGPDHRSVTVWRDGAILEEHRITHAPDGAHIDERIRGAWITRTEVDTHGRRTLHGTDYRGDGDFDYMDAYDYLDEAAVPGPWLSAHAHTPAHALPGATRYVHRCGG